MFLTYFILVLQTSAELIFQVERKTDQELRIFNKFLLFDKMREFEEEKIV